MAPVKPSADLREVWAKEQERLSKLCVENDELDWCVHGQFIQGLRRVAGVDVSFFPDGVHAVASVVVISYPDMEVLYDRCEAFQLKVPYVCGFLAFREVPAFKALLEKVPEKFTPQVVLVDGNGVYHPRRCGSATHLGVVTGLPTVGVAKDVLQVGDVKLSTAREVAQKLQGASDWAPLVGGGDEDVPSAALLRPNIGKKHLVVSAGHKITLNTAIILTASLCKATIPEPIRQADLRSRAAVRRWFTGTSLTNLKMPKQDGAGNLLRMTMPYLEMLGNATTPQNKSNIEQGVKPQPLTSKKRGMVWRIKVPNGTLTDPKSEEGMAAVSAAMDESSWGVWQLFWQSLSGLCIARQR